MRNVRFVLPLSLAFSAVLGACALPERRPEADFDVRDCPNPGPTPVGTPVKLGSVLNHHECLTLDASESAVFTGSARYEWKATVSPGDLTTGAPRTLTLGSAMTIQGIFFRDFPINLATVDLTLTVTDGSGQRRTRTEQLNLLNRAPSITAPARIVRPRSLDLLFSPFLVVRGAEVQDPDCDYEPAATIDDPISCDVSDVYVQNVGGAVPLHGSRCADVPARTDDPAVTGDGLPDPYPEDPAAWCFDIFPIDDVRTPNENEVATRRSAFSPYEESIDFRFQFEAVDRGAPPAIVDGSGCNDGVVIQGPLGEGNSVACQTVRYEDAVWVARGGATVLQPGVLPEQTIPGSVGRVAPDWRRQQPGFVLPALASGAARDRRGVQWLGGLVPVSATCFDMNTCPHVVIGYDEKVGVRGLSGLGPIIGLEGDPLGGLWIAALSVDTAGNPASLTGGPVFLPQQPYVAFVPEGMLPAPTATTDLKSAPASQLIFLTNFGAETPRRIAPTDAGDLWLATTNVANGSGTLRYLPAAMLSLGAVIDLQLLTPVASACAGAGWTFPGDAYADVLAAGDNGRVWAVDLSFDPDDGHPLSRVCLLDGAGTVSHEALADYSVVSSLAFDPGRTDAPARPDMLWMADAASQSMLSASDVLTGPVAVDIDGYTSGPFADIAALAVDDLGGLWADSHPEPFTRAPLFIEPATRNVLELERYLSLGRGIEAASLFERSTWRADGLFDVVRAPAASVEIPAFAFAPDELRLLGVDQVDGAAYAIAPNPNGDNFFRFSADGGVTALGHLAGIPTSGIVLPEVLGPGYAIPATLWLSVVYQGNPVPRLVSITVDRLRQMAAEGAVIDGDLAYCGDGAVFADRATLAFLPPCWLQQVDATASGLTFAPREMVLSFEPNRLLVYLLSRPSTASPQTVIAALNPFAPYETAAPMIAASVLPAGEVKSLLPHPMFAADSLADPPVSGVWLVRNDGQLRRWHLADPSTTTTTTFVSLEIHPVPPGLLVIDPNYRAVAGANDRVNAALWVTYAAFGRPTELWRYRSLPDSLGSAVLLDSAAKIQLSGGGDSLAVAPFTGLLWAAYGGFGSPWLGSVWTSGDDGALVRISTLHDGQFSLVNEYSRKQRSSEDFPVTPTPAGYSIFAGGL